MTFAEGDLRVWYIPQIPMKPFLFAVPDMPTALLVEEALIGLSTFEFENNVKPDYSDAGGIERYEPDGEGGLQWFEVDRDDS